MIYFLVYLFLEVMISSYFASLFGGFLTFIFIISSAIVGIVLLKNFNYSLKQNINDLSQGKITQEEFTKTNMSKALGAILLIVPGFFTDIIGLLLQFEILTMILGKIFTLKSQNNYTSPRAHTSANNFTYDKNKNIDNDIIDVEIIEIDNENKNRDK